MAHGGTTRVLPSPTGGGLTAGAQAFAEQRRQAREFEQQQQQLDLADRAQKFNEVLAIIPWMEPGTTIAEAPEFFKSRVGSLFPDMDPNDPEDFGGVQINNDPEAAFNRVLVEELGAMQAEGEGLLDEGLIDRYIALQATGQPTTEGQRNLEGVMTDFQIDSMRELGNNPQLLEDAGRVMVGMDQPVRFNFLGQDYEFDSEAAGSIWASLMQERFRGMFNLQAAREDQRLDPVETLMDQYSAAFDNERQLGQAAASNIVNAWRASQQGDFEPGQSPIEELYRSAGPDVRQGIQLLTGVMRAGDQRWQGVLENTPGGPQVLFFDWIAGRNKENFGTEEGLEETRNFVRQFEDQGFGISIERPMFGVAGRPRFIFERGSPQETMSRDVNEPLPQPGETGSAPPPEDSVGRDMALQTIRESVAAGLPPIGEDGNPAQREGESIEDAWAREMGPELVNEALADQRGGTLPSRSFRHTPTNQEEGGESETQEEPPAPAPPPSDSPEPTRGRDPVSSLSQTPEFDPIRETIRKGGGEVGSFGFNPGPIDQIDVSAMREASLEDLEALETSLTNALQNAEEMSQGQTGPQNRNFRVLARQQMREITELLGRLGIVLHQKRVMERQGNAER